MPPPSGPWQRRLQAIAAAGELLDELGVDQHRPIDVFSLCEDLGLWLVFADLDGLLGAFVPEGTGGVLITTQRPIPIQRYTAAHELGHWRLDHARLALDDEEQIVGATPRESEQLAQLFASYFLLPPPLVFDVLARLGPTQPSALGPDEIYALARETGVSFEAAVRHLGNLEVLTDQEVHGFIGMSPLAIKTRLGRGRRPVDGYADVWPVDERWDGQVVALNLGDELLVALPENRSTGYRWMSSELAAAATARLPSAAPPPIEGQVVPTDDVRRLPMPDPVRKPSPMSANDIKAATARLPRSPVQPLPAATRGLASPQVEFVGDDFAPGWAPWVTRRQARRVHLRIAEGSQPVTITEAEGSQAVDSSEAPIVGATGRRFIAARATQPGPFTLRFSYTSRYDPSASPIAEFAIHGLVEPRRRGFSLDQVVADADEDWVESARLRRLTTDARSATTDDVD